MVWQLVSSQAARAAQVVFGWPRNQLMWQVWRWARVASWQLVSAKAERVVFGWPTNQLTRQVELVEEVPG